MALRKTNSEDAKNSASTVKKGKVNIKVLFAILLTVFVIGAGSAFGYNKFFASDNQGPLFKKESKEEMALSSMELGDIVINLNGSMEDHFLKTRIVIEYPEDKKVEELVKEKKPHIIETVLVTLRKKTIVDVKPPQATEQLKGELIDNINNRLKDDIVKNIIFTQYIVQ